MSHVRYTESDAEMDMVEQTLEVSAGAARALLVGVEGRLVSDGRGRSFARGGSTTWAR
jgi:hypothetical protein